MALVPKKNRRKAMQASGGIFIAAVKSRSVRYS